MEPTAGGKDLKPEPTVINIQGMSGGSLVMMAGPCAVESEEQLMETALPKTGVNFYAVVPTSPELHPIPFRV